MAAVKANALAEAYLQFRTQGAEDVAEGQIAELERKVSELVTKESLTAPEESLLASMRDELASLRLVGNVPGRVISRAITPTEPSSPGVSVVLAGTVALGLLAGCGLALGRERSRRLAPLERNLRWKSAEPTERDQRRSA